MNDNYWLVIDTLLHTLEHGRDEEKLKEAIFRLSVAIDSAVVANEPQEELERLRGTLECVKYNILPHE